ncbi:MAG TPA: ECF transporter S component, partial [Firmicutes bacterium]|nr:ECF transporter S component [Bacillota bacterium]
MLTPQKRIDAKYLTKTSVLLVFAFLIMMVEFPLWFAPPFLKLDFSDVPALIGAFAMGPVTGVVIELIKNILHLTIKGTTTVGVGELANFIVGSVFVFTAASIYHYHKSLKTAIIGMISATIVMTAMAAVANYFFLLPFFAALYGVPLDLFVQMGAQVNSFVYDLKTLVVFAISPLNFVKGVLISV